MSLFVDFKKGGASAISDIRQKVVEEPWFGHAVTDSPQEPASPAPVAPIEPRDLWDEKVQQVKALPDKEISEPEHITERLAPHDLFSRRP